MTTLRSFTPAKNSSIQRDLNVDHLTSQSFDKIPVYPNGQLPLPQSLNARQGMIAFEQRVGLGVGTIGGELKFFNGTAWISTIDGSGDVVGPASATDNAIARYNGTTGKLIQNSLATIDDAGILTATNISGTNTGNVTLAAVDSAGVANVNGSTLTGQVFNLRSATDLFAGVVNTGVQTFAGAKTFTGTITASNLSGTNTGNVTLAAVDSAGVANVNGSTLTGQVLNLMSATDLFAGVVTTGVQTFAGAKTFTNTITASNLSGTNTGDVTLAAVDSAGIANANGATLTGQVINLRSATALFAGVVNTGVQSFAGAKTFTNTITASNLSGTNTGDVTLAVIDSAGVANANGATLTGQVLNLRSATASFGGIVNTGTQSFAGAKTFSTSIALPNTTNSTTGVFFMNTTPYFHNFSTTGTKNVFLGGAGNFTAATGNSLGTNFGVGVGALSSLTTGFSNIALGVDALGSMTSGFGNIGIGTSAIGTATGGNGNVFIGINSGAAMTSASNNVALGPTTLNSVTTGGSNVALGPNAGLNLLTGTNNVMIGSTAGSALVGAESNDILISSVGLATESATIRIGTTGLHTNTLVAGVYAATGQTAVAGRKYTTVLTDGTLGGFTVVNLELIAFFTAGAMGTTAGTISTPTFGSLSPPSPNSAGVSFSNTTTPNIILTLRGNYWIRTSFNATSSGLITDQMIIYAQYRTGPNIGALTPWRAYQSTAGPVIVGIESASSGDMMVFTKDTDSTEVLTIRLVGITIPAGGTVSYDAQSSMQIFYQSLL